MSLKFNSYSPYSGREESCLIKGKSGKFYPGVRIENISYPLTISAIRAAVCSCLGAGDQPTAFYQPEPASELQKYWIEEFNLGQLQNLPDNIDLFDPVIPDVQDIPKILTELCLLAVTPHSDFPVSALLETKTGFISGVNVEVTSWSLGLCAERLAIARAIAHDIQEFRAIHVHAPKSEFCSPCGSCRQVLNEFMADEVVKLYHKDHTLSSHFTQHLLPYGIISEDLKNK